LVALVARPASLANHVREIATEIRIVQVPRHAFSEMAKRLFRDAVLVEVVTQMGMTTASRLLRQRRPMTAQLDFNPTATNVQEVACVALLAGVLLADRCACRKGVRPLVDLGSH